MTVICEAANGEPISPAYVEISSVMARKLEKKRKKAFRAFRVVIEDWEKYYLFNSKITKLIL